MADKKLPKGALSKADISKAVGGGPQPIDPNARTVGPVQKGSSEWLKTAPQRVAAKTKSLQAEATKENQSQIMAMQGAVSGAVQNVMTQLFPSSTIPMYDQSVQQGMAAISGSLNGSNGALKSLAAQGGNNPAMQTALSQAQSTGAAASGATLPQIGAGMNNILAQEANTNQMFEQHLPGLLQTAGANDLAATYYTGTLANALKYQEIYQAGINLGDVPKDLLPYAGGASSQAANIASLSAGGTNAGAGNNEINNPFGAQGTQTKVSTNPSSY